MTEPRRKMIESLKLRGLFECTQDSYVRAVRQLADHYHKSPDLISEEEIRQYFLLQGFDDRSDQVLDHPGRGVNPPLSPARPARSFCQGQVLRAALAVQSAVARKSPGATRRQEPFSFLLAAGAGGRGTSSPLPLPR